MDGACVIYTTMSEHFTSGEQIFSVFCKLCRISFCVCLSSEHRHTSNWKLIADCRWKSSWHRRELCALSNWLRLASRANTPSKRSLFKKYIFPQKSQRNWIGKNRVNRFSIFVSSSQIEYFLVDFDCEELLIFPDEKGEVENNYQVIWMEMIQSFDIIWASSVIYFASACTRCSLTLPRLPPLSLSLAIINHSQ